MGADADLPGPGNAWQAAVLQFLSLGVAADGGGDSGQGPGGAAGAYHGGGPVDLAPQCRMAAHAAGRTGLSDSCRGDASLGHPCHAGHRRRLSRHRLPWRLRRQGEVQDEIARRACRDLSSSGRNPALAAEPADPARRNQAAVVAAACRKPPLPAGLGGSVLAADRIRADKAAALSDARGAGACRAAGLRRRRAARRACRGRLAAGGASLAGAGDRRVRHGLWPADGGGGDLGGADLWRGDGWPGICLCDAGGADGRACRVAGALVAPSWRHRAFVAYAGGRHPVQHDYRRRADPFAVAGSSGACHRGRNRRCRTATSGDGRCRHSRTFAGVRIRTGSASGRRRRGGAVSCRGARRSRHCRAGPAAGCSIWRPAWGCRLPPRGRSRGSTCQRQECANLPLPRRRV